MLCAILRTDVTCHDLTGRADKKINIQVCVCENEDAFEQTAALFRVREVSHCSLLFTLIKKNNNTFTHHRITRQKFPTSE